MAERGRDIGTCCFPVKESILCTLFGVGLANVDIVGVAIILVGLTEELIFFPLALSSEASAATEFEAVDPDPSLLFCLMYLLGQRSSVSTIAVFSLMTLSILCCRLSAPPTGAACGTFLFVDKSVGCCGGEERAEDVVAAALIRGRGAVGNCGLVVGGIATGCCGSLR
jgi:hypothetical protein